LWTKPKSMSRAKTLLISDGAAGISGEQAKTFGLEPLGARWGVAMLPTRVRGVYQRRCCAYAAKSGRTVLLKVRAG
jgi:hypothetical protein